MTKISASEEAALCRGWDRTEAMERLGTFTAAELAAETGETVAAVSAVLVDLAEAGVADDLGDGRYRAWT